MSNILIKFKDGSEREFLHEGRPGGSYTKRVKHENGWIIITDEYSNRTSFPADEVKEVVEIPHRDGW